MQKSGKEQTDQCGQKDKLIR